ncbi:uncharacterized protein LOC134185178 [Corticium candelabrum]|uniref:uncharacterized protein LOC134185178 n=1 Tax=Corticium candelabrum TaxID=121492 RepID=UPI002E26AE82|nr:uncharacterized protein LOC134185178 [Corticium candelabrum]
MLNGPVLMILFWFLDAASTRLRHIGVVSIAVSVIFAVGFEVWKKYNAPLTSFSLPSNTPYLIGRDAEVENISQLLSFRGRTGTDENPNIVNIVGAPGFGKSTLAIAVGNELLKRGIHVHYADLNGVNSSQDATATILDTVTWKLGVINDKNYVHWAKSVHRRTVLILDNCDDLMQGEAVRNAFFKILTEILLMSHSLRLLTTARYNYTMLDVKTVSFLVQSLSTKYATQLLLDMSPHTKSSAAFSLANLTGRAALAIKIVGGLLNEGDLEEQLVKELSMSPIKTLSPQEFQPEAQIKVVIASSFRRLSSALVQCIAILAHMPGSFDESAAAAALNIETHSARKLCLKPITKRCLLEFDHNIKRYHMHKLINAFVKEELRMPIGSQTIRDRLVYHFFYRLLHLAAKYDENPRDVLRIYDRDQHNFQNVVTHYMNITIAVTGNDLVRLSVVMLSEQAANLFFIRLPADQLFRWYRAAREYAARLEYGKSKENYCNVVYLLIKAAMKEANRNHINITLHLEEESHLHLVAQCSDDLRFRMVERICIKPYELLFDIPDSVFDCYHTHAQILMLPVGHNHSFMWLGHQFYNHRVNNAALKCFMKAGADFGDTDVQDKVLHLESAFDVFEGKGELDKNPLLRKMFAIANDEAVSSSQLHTVFIDIGSLGIRLSNYYVAIESLLRGYEILKDLVNENDEQILRVYYLLGKAYSLSDHFEEAVNYFNKSLSISKTLLGNDHWHTALCHERLGMAMAKLEVVDAEEVELNLMEAARVYGEVLEDNRKLFNVLMNIGHWRAIQFRLFSAADYYYKAYRILYKINGTKPQSETVSSSTTKDLQISQPSVSIYWAYSASKLYKYAATLMPDAEDPFVNFYWSFSTIFCTRVALVCVSFLLFILIIVILLDYCGK